MQPASSLPLLERLSISCNRYAERSLLVLGLTMAVTVIVQVFCRYILNHSLFWSEELARYLLVWLTFLGASVAYRRHMHPCIDIVYRRIQSRNKRFFRLVMHVLSLGFFLLLVWFGCEFAYFVRLQSTPALALPKWIVLAVVPASGAILTLHALAFLYKDLKDSGGQS